MLVDRHILVVINDGGVVQVLADCEDVKVDIIDSTSLSDEAFERVVSCTVEGYPFQGFYTVTHDDDAEALCLAKTHAPSTS